MKYKGVSFYNARRGFQANIKYKKQPVNIGYYKNEIDAAKAYDKKAKELFGEFAYLNFPEDHA